MRLSIPPTLANLRWLLIFPMRNHRLRDIKGLDQLLPRRVVDRKDGLVFADLLLTLLLKRMRLCDICTNNY